MSSARLVMLLFLASLPTLASAAPCAGFDDVNDTSPFCADVAWIANRGITLGCATGLYCPDVAVSRLSMAVFLHRLGNMVEDRFPRLSGIQLTQTTPLAPGASEIWSTHSWPLARHVLWRAVPTTTGSRLAVTNVSLQNDGNGTGTWFITVQNQGAAAGAYTLSYSVLE